MDVRYKSVDGREQCAYEACHFDALPHGILIYSILFIIITIISVVMHTKLIARRTSPAMRMPFCQPYLESIKYLLFRLLCRTYNVLPPTNIIHYSFNHLTREDFDRHKSLLSDEWRVI